MMGGLEDVVKFLDRDEVNNSGKKMKKKKKRGNQIEESEPATSKIISKGDKGSTVQESKNGKIQVNKLSSRHKKIRIQKRFLFIYSFQMKKLL